MKNKKLFIAAAALAAAVALLLGVYFVTRPEGVAGEKSVTVEVVHGDGTIKTFPVKTDEEFLSYALIAEGILTDEGIETGMYNTVDGETAKWDPDQAYWGFYVNGEYATEGMNTTPVIDGYTYKLEYTVSDYAG